MEPHWHRRTLHLTFVLVVASLGLVVAGLAGAGASLAVVAALIALAGVLFVLRPRLDGPTVLRHDLGEYGALLWIGPGVAATVCLLFFGATPAELQSLGGLVGLAGMANYFLRPVYRTGYALVRRVTGT